MRKMTSERDLSPTAQRLLDLRKEKGLTQKAFSDKLDINISTLARVETGAYSVSLELVEKVMEVFKLSASDLIQPKRKPSERQKRLDSLIVRLRAVEPDDQQCDSLDVVVNAFERDQHVKAIILPKIVSGSGIDPR